MSIIDIKGLTLAYGGAAVVRGLDLTVEKGDYICVVGENGSGKTTLIKSILGLVKPVSGEINIEPGLGFGYLPQQSDIQRDFPATAEEVVLSGFSGTGLFLKPSQKKYAASVAEKVGIKNIYRKCYRDLSGGLKQRVLLARALCSASDVLVLDEPITGLDPLASADMYSLIKKLNGSGITVIMISHDIAEAVANAGKILHLSENSAFFGSVDEYLSSDIGEKFFKGKNK